MNPTHPSSYRLPGNRWLSLIASWHDPCPSGGMITSTLIRLKSALPNPSKKILQAMILTFLLSFATTAVAQLMLSRMETGRASNSSTASEREENEAGVDNSELKALPATLPQGRLYCSEGAKLGYLRFYPKSFQQISPEDALSWSKEGVEVSCADSWSAESCKGALKALALVRKSIQRCQTGA